MRSSTDIAFSPTVKAIQEARGSRSEFAGLESRGGWRTALTPEVAEFLAVARTCYLATANADGQPYVQHRGGPPGFLRVLDERTIAFADFRGNRQYITTGNVKDNPKAFLFVMDYQARRRLKFWGQARIVTDDVSLVQDLRPAGYAAEPEQAIIFSVETWDTNCSQHIPALLPADEVARTVAGYEARIAALEAEIAALRNGG